LVEVGICKLCLEDKPLCDSHLVPSALYKMCAKGGKLISLNSKTIKVAEGEVSFPLLCSDCEQRLSKDGENWLLPKLANKDRTFPLYDILVTGTPDAVFDGRAAYACSRIDNFAFRKITNFAIGIFWKASVHSWKPDVRKTRIDLGRYREQFRLFLLNKGPFPKNATLSVGVSPPQDATSTFNLPHLTHKHPHFSYLQVIPGMVFVLNVGNRLCPEDRDTCFFSNPIHPLIVRNMRDRIDAHFRSNFKDSVMTDEVKELGKKFGYKG